MKLKQKGIGFPKPVPFCYTLIMIIEDITNQKINGIFLDLDGVCANLVKGLATVCNIPVEKVARDTSVYWDHAQKIMNCKDIFASLDFESNAHRLLKFFDDRKIPYTFLTCPAAEPNTADSIEGKNTWLRNKGLGNIPVIFEKYKEKYATTNGQPNLLIDDRGRNIREWNNAGGIAIKYKNKNFNECLKKLEELFDDND